MVPRQVLLRPTATSNPLRHPQYLLQGYRILSQSPLLSRDLHNAIQALLSHHHHLPEVLLSRRHPLLFDQLVLHLCILLAQLLHAQE